jgi:glycosyltransferase involved in cell wall biosynthesis
LKERIVKAGQTQTATANRDKFTIITSGYNKGKYLDEWTDSIVRQKYRPLEVVFANDKSTDDTSARIKSMEEKFKANGIEFKFVNNKKQLFCGGSYHNLIKYISGFYVGVLDADDMLEEGAVEYIMKLYKDHPDIYWIYTQFLWCNEQMVRGRTGLNSVPPKGQSLLDLGDRGVHGIGTGWRTFSLKIERPDKLFGKHLACAVDKNMGYRLEEYGPGLFTGRKCYIHRGHPVGSTDSVSSTKNAMKMWKQVIGEAHRRRKTYKKKIYPIKELK